jgi:hypothetical protein
VRVEVQEVPRLAAMGIGILKEKDHIKEPILMKYF